LDSGSANRKEFSYTRQDNTEKSKICVHAAKWIRNCDPSIREATRHNYRDRTLNPEKVSMRSL